MRRVVPCRHDHGRRGAVQRGLFSPASLAALDSAAALHAPHLPASAWAGHTGIHPAHGPFCPPCALPRRTRPACAPGRRAPCGRAGGQSTHWPKRSTSASGSLKRRAASTKGGFYAAVDRLGNGMRVGHYVPVPCDVVGQICLGRSSYRTLRRSPRIRSAARTRVVATECRLSLSMSDSPRRRSGFTASS